MNILLLLLLLQVQYISDLGSKFSVSTGALLVFVTVPVTRSYFKLYESSLIYFPTIVLCGFYFQTYLVQTLMKLKSDIVRGWCD